MDVLIGNLPFKQVTFSGNNFIIHVLAVINAIRVNAAFHGREFSLLAIRFNVKPGSPFFQGTLHCPQNLTFSL